LSGHCPVGGRTLFAIFLFSPLFTPPAPRHVLRCVIGQVVDEQVLALARIQKPGLYQGRSEVAAVAGPAC